MAHTPITAEDLREVLPTALAVSRWVDDVLEGAPYGSLDILIDAALDAATPLTDAEIDEALAHHPRIGERPEGESREAELSLAEQGSADADDADLAAQIAEGNRDYEARFNRVFLIRAAGRSRAEILIELRRRLTLDDETESATAAEQLRQIMELRLRTLFAETALSDAASSARSHITTHVLDQTIGRPAPRVPVKLEAESEGQWHLLADGVTDEDGRLSQLGPEQLPAGRYRVTFNTAAYFAAQDAISFYPEVAVAFEIWSTEEHFHIPLLLSPFGYSTYRGS